MTPPSYMAPDRRTRSHRPRSDPAPPSRPTLLVAPLPSPPIEDPIAPPSSLAKAAELVTRFRDHMDICAHRDALLVVHASRPRLTDASAGRGRQKRRHRKEEGTSQEDALRYSIACCYGCGAPLHTGEEGATSSPPLPFFF
jgi:hypothetical protein